VQNKFVDVFVVEQKDVDDVFACEIGIWGSIPVWAEDIGIRTLPHNLNNHNINNRTASD
jgi:hypothetical protein